MKIIHEKMIRELKVIFDGNILRLKSEIRRSGVKTRELMAFSSECLVDRCLDIISKT